MFRRDWLFPLGIFLLGLMLSLAFSPAARADELLLKNGDRLSGRVIQLENGVLTFGTDYTEDIKVQVTQIRKIATTGPVTVHASNGWVVVGKLRPRDGDHVGVLYNGGDSSATIPWGKVTAINPTAHKWKGSLALGGTTQSGNTDRTNITGEANLRRRLPSDRFLFHLIHNFSQEDGATTGRNTYGKAKVDHFFHNGWYAFGVLDMLNDEFRDLNLRTSVGPGLGYQVWEQEGKSLALEAGLTYFSEDRISQADDQWLSGRLAADYETKLWGFVHFSNYFVAFPSFKDLSDYNFRNEAAVRTNLYKSLGIKITNIWQYDNQPSNPSIKKTDLQTIFALEYSF